jgi:DNA-directed RNA polymerase specialized sigma24 family protein
MWGPPTRWSVVRRAADPAPGLEPERERAWRDLIERYREPVAASLARALRGDPSASEATDQFFGYLVEHGILRKADPEQGRFRCYVQGVVRRFALHWRRATRAGEALELEEDLPLGHAAEPAEEADEARWASQVLSHAAARLFAEHPRDAELLLAMFGLPPFASASREELCTRFGLSADAFNVALFRARARLRERVLIEVRDTVATADDFEREREWIIERLMAAHPQLVTEDP